MKKGIIALACGCGLIIISTTVSLIETIRDHKKYNKGFNDGMALAFAMCDLKDTLQEIKENHKEEKES